MNRKEIAWIAFVAAGLAGCVSYQSVLEPHSSFEPLGRSQAGQAGLIRMFFIHGMGTNDPDYAKKFVTRMGDSFKLTSGPNDETQDIQVDDSKGYKKLQEFPWPATLRVYRFKDEGGVTRLVAYAFFWEGLTTGTGRIKEAVLGDDGEVPRAFANRWLKQGLDGKSGLMDDALADVVLYVDHYHRDVIHRAAVNALGIFMAGTYDGEVDPKAKVEVDFVTHSLGGIILTDALGVYWKHLVEKHPHRRDFDAFGSPVVSSSEAAEANDKSGHRYEEIITHTKAMYMLANQIPFLSMARMDTLPIGGVTGATSPTSGKVEAPQGTSPRLLNLATYLGASDEMNVPVAHLIAFSDPNDQLTWQIDSRNATGGTIGVINIRLRNTCDFFGLVENPYSAHLGYWTNPKVTDFILHGGSAP